MYSESLVVNLGLQSQAPHDCRIPVDARRCAPCFQDEDCPLRDHLGPQSHNTNIVNRVNRPRPSCFLLFEQITEAFRRFEVSDASSSLLVVRVGSQPLHARAEVAQVWKHHGSVGWGQHPWAWSQSAVDGGQEARGHCEADNQVVVSGYHKACRT